MTEMVMKQKTKKLEIKVSLTAHRMEALFICQSNLENVIRWTSQQEYMVV